MIALLAALGVAQATAAALTVTKATVDDGIVDVGATSISTPPGGVFSAEVTTKVNPGETWAATDARIGTDTTCVNHGDESAVGHASRRPST